MFSPQCLAHFQHRLRGGNCEARRHCVEQASAAMKTSDQVAAIAIRRACDSSPSEPLLEGRTLPANRAGSGRGRLAREAVESGYAYRSSRATETRLAYR